ncbi:hypothetical protein CHCC20490_3327 [Bacillus paralicheniformis]|nr:hypothetical protein CHCC20490_3327 [Bacillus paralicheniformis]
MHFTTLSKKAITLCLPFGIFNMYVDQNDIIYPFQKKR